MSDTRTVKALQSTREALTFQREWFKATQRRILDGTPYALVNADAPHELFRAFDVPYVVNQWWASVCAAKQKSTQYLDVLDRMGYPHWSDQYGSLALASILAQDPDAPWGGLPAPRFVSGYLKDDAQGKILELWERETGARLCSLAGTVSDEVPLTWHETIQHDWETVIGSERLDLGEAELWELVEVLEAETGRAFDEQAFAEIMRLANEHAEWNRRTRDLIAATSPAPVSLVDALPAVMTRQWHRGSQAGVDGAKRLYEEVAQRAERGEGAEERIRLAWIGRGLWSNMPFYQHFEDRYGAVFVCSMYLSVAADGYLRYGDNPMRALAARFVAFDQQINMPPWSTEWYLNEARRHRVDGVVHLRGDAKRGAPFITRALRDAGIPVCEISAHNVDQRQWNDEEIKAHVTEFIEGLGR